MKRPALITLLTALFLAFSYPVLAEDTGWQTTTALVGESKYRDGFSHYDYVNPEAPKGGTLNKAARGGFDSFNPFIVQGEPPNGLNYFGGLLWDTLMEQGTDESSVSHPMIAQDFKHPADYSSATYRLNPKARWHDGKPIIAEDVKFSMETLKEFSPQHSAYFKNVKEVRVDNERQVTFIFDQKNNRELPHIMGDLPILPKHWWEGTDANGKKRDFIRSTLERTLGNGPYKIGKFTAGSSIEWERVEDYWAADLPVRKGRYNYDRIRYTFFKDENAQWEAFKKGGIDDYRDETSSRRWAIQYDFPAVKDGRVRKQDFEFGRAYVNLAIYLNTRRERFQDRRVRKALTWSFNFDRLNKDVFYGLYAHSTSYFGGTELSAKGKPSPAELEILEKYRGKIPDEVFTDEYVLPSYKSRRDERKHLRTALDLLKEAGWVRDGTKLVNEKTGEQFKIEIIATQQSSLRTMKPWMDSLKKLGIDASFRVIDTSQYINRYQKFDYDVFLRPTIQSNSPGNEQREYWSSAAADTPGSRNMAGIKNPVIDELIERIIYAEDREEQIALVRAMERILQFEYYGIPAWYAPVERYAIWDKIIVPEKQPLDAGVDPFSWWIDPEKS